MEIIMNYIDSMFAGVPVTEQTKRLRDDITANMCDKYDELINEGKSGNEAIGTVISEFGNIDEVLSEMGVSRTAPAAVQTDDPAGKHRKRIARFGVLAGIGAGFVALGAALVSEFAVRGYARSFGTVGFGILMTGMILLILSVLVRTSIFANGGSIPQDVIPLLRMKYEKNRQRDFGLRMIFDGLKLFALGVFVMSEPWYGNVTGSAFMCLCIAAAFSVEVYVTLVDRMYRQILGETMEKPEVLRLVRFATVPFFAGVIMFIQYNMDYGYTTSSALTGSILLILLYMAVCVGAEMFDLAKKRVAKTGQVGGSVDVSGK